MALRIIPIAATVIGDCKHGQFYRPRGTRKVPVQGVGRYVTVVINSVDRDGSVTHEEGPIPVPPGGKACDGIVR